MKNKKTICVWVSREEKPPASLEKRNQELTLDVLDAKLLDNLHGHDAGCKSAAEHGAEFRVQTTNAHIFKIPVWADNGSLPARVERTMGRDLGQPGTRGRREKEERSVPTLATKPAPAPDKMISEPGAAWNVSSVCVLVKAGETKAVLLSLRKDKMFSERARYALANRHLGGLLDARALACDWETRCQVSESLISEQFRSQDEAHPPSSNAFSSIL